MNTKETKTKTAEKTAPAKIETYDLSNSADTMHLAVDVAKFIKENKLYQNIQGKEFVNVEGWQYAGSRLGIYPVIETVNRVITDGTEIVYEARATLLNTRTGQTVGAGMAVCSNKENGKKYYQEFAIASMAQTRAIGKGYRNMLAWVIRAAGYEPTPAEEMDYSGNTPEVKVSGAAPAPAATATKAQEVKPQPAPKQETEAPGEAAPAAGEDQEQPQVKYATAKQKEEIIRLLNNVVITRQEKTKMLLNINKLDEERAAQSIQKLRKVTEEREEQSRNAGDEFIPAVNPENAPMSEIFRKELYDLSKELGGPANAQKTRETIIKGFSKMAAALDYKAELKAAIAAKI